MPLFKTESDAKSYIECKISQFAIYLLFSEINFLSNKCFFLFQWMKLMTSVFFNMVGIYLYLMLVRLVSLFKTESEAKLI